MEDLWLAGTIDDDRYSGFGGRVKLGFEPLQSSRESSGVHEAPLRVR